MACAAGERAHTTHHPSLDIDPPHHILSTFILQRRTGRSTCGPHSGSPYRLQERQAEAHRGECQRGEQGAAVDTVRLVAELLYGWRIVQRFFLGVHVARASRCQEDSGTTTGLQ